MRPVVQAQTVLSAGHADCVRGAVCVHVCMCRVVLLYVQIDTVRKLCPFFSTTIFRKGDVVVRQGDKADGECALHTTTCSHVHDAMQGTVHCCERTCLLSVEHRSSRFDRKNTTLI